MLKNVLIAAYILFVLTLAAMARADVETGAQDLSDLNSNTNLQTLSGPSLLNSATSTPSSLSVSTGLGQSL